MARRYRIPALEKHATEIGYICIWWSLLEVHLDNLLAAVVPLETGEISESITSNADLRDKIQMLKAVGFKRQTSKEWFDTLERVLNCIDNELRPARNRMTHDLWIISGRDAIRRTRRTSLNRPRSFERALSTYIDTPIAISSLRALAAEFHHACQQLIQLKFWHESTLRHGS